MTWTQDDLLLLTSNFQNSTFTELAAALGKSCTSVYRMSLRIGLRKKTGSRSGPRESWSAMEEDLLRNLYMECSIDSISNRLDRSAMSIYMRANKLGLKRPQHLSGLQNFGSQWSTKEIEILECLSSRMSITEISKIIRRSQDAIRKRLKSMKLKALPNFSNESAWTSEQQKTLEKNIQAISMEELSEVLGKSIKSIYKMRKKLNLIKQKHSHWSDVDTIYLKNNYSKTSWKNLIDTLCRPKHQIQDKARRLNIKRASAEKIHTQQRTQRTRRTPTPIGFERKHGEFLLRKIASTGVKKSDWKRVDVIEWEQINGPVPEGMVLFRIDRSKPRGPSNLILKSQGEHPLTSFTANCSPQMRTILGLKSRISQQMNKLENRSASI